jgi:hypothetical protein
MTGDPPALSLRSPAPDTVVDVVDHGVFQAGLFHRAIGADPSRHFYPHTVTREERVRRHLPALPPPHPRSVHDTIVTCSVAQRYGSEDIRRKS